MKKWLSAILILSLMGSARAAVWTEGTGPERPYPGKAAVDLGENMGYMLVYPTSSVGGSAAALQGRLFCDVLCVYLPREDISPGKGKMLLYEGGRVIQTIDAQDMTCVRVRPMTEGELQGLKWGSGVCLEASLDRSLSFDGDYQVTVDAGFFTAEDGRIDSLPITRRDGWSPKMGGDYGVSGLVYTRSGLQWTGQDGEMPTRTPGAGDRLAFDLILGGDAKYAVLMSMSGTVHFDQVEFSQSGPVEGLITGDDPDWTVVFLNERGDPIDEVRLRY